MSVTRIKKFPEAPIKITYYENVIVSLQKDKESIDNYIFEINSTLNKFGVLSEDTELGGEYYDYYLGKKDIWVSECINIIGTFDTFCVELEQCISRAKEIKSEWEYKDTLYDYIWE